MLVELEDGEALPRRMANGKESCQHENMDKKVMRRVLVLAFAGPVVATPLLLLGWRGRGLEWWRYLAVILGLSYLFPVLVTLGGWRLVVLADKAGRAVSFLVRALIGTSSVFALITLGTLVTGRSFEEWLEHFFRSPLQTGAAFTALVVIGVLYAAFYGRAAHEFQRLDDKFDRWIQRGRQKKQEQKGPL